VALIQAIPTSIPSVPVFGTGRPENARAWEAVMTAHSDFSIVAIIPLYNGARWIEQAIVSVLSQTRQPDEFIIVDDGSTDGGAGAAIGERMAREHPIIKLLHKPNGGQSSARNFGVAHSKSTLIAFLDQDDAWYPHHLETLVKPLLERHAMPLGWVYSNIDLVTENGEMFCYEYLNDLKVEHPKRHLVRCFNEDMHILPSASLILRQAFESVVALTNASQDMRTTTCSCACIAPIGATSIFRSRFHFGV
jgi:glycosyltransferase involved in cell wall biosynthesis